MPIKDLIGITVSTNYDDILKHIIHQNQKFFEVWYIITEYNDTKTIKLIEDSGYSNIILLFYKFTDSICKFNKGGAIQHVQNLIDSEYTAKNILLVDSDIYLSDQLYLLIESLDVQYDSLYSVVYRHDCKSYIDLEKNLKNSFELTDQNADYLGYFQLYKQDPLKKYLYSYDCSMCDLQFAELFSKMVPIKGVVYHLGISGVHWQGRYNSSDFESQTN